MEIINAEQTRELLKLNQEMRRLNFANPFSEEEPKIEEINKVQERIDEIIRKQVNILVNEES